VSHDGSPGLASRPGGNGAEVTSDGTKIGDGPTPCAEVTARTARPSPAPPGGPPCLIVAAAPRADAIGRTFDLAEGQEYVIGRSREAHLQVQDPGISRRHARVRCPREGVYVVFDLESSNGTYLNGRRVQRAVLREGDRIQLGTATVLRFSTRRHLDERERRHHQALAAAGVGTWEWDARAHVLSFTGGSVQWMRGGGPDGWLAVHPGDRQRLRDDLQRVVATGGSADLECRVLGEADRVSWVSLRGELLSDEAGAPFRIAGALVDVSTRKKAEQELRRQALMFECLSDAVFVVDLAGVILDWNPAAARILGHSRAEALGRNPGDLLEPGEPQPFVEAAATGVAADGRWKGERWLRRKGGAICQAELDVVPLQDAAGHHLANLVVCRDVGEQRRLQAQILLADRLSAMGTLAAGVAHEINNPLAFIRANVGSLGEMIERPEGLGAGDLQEALDMLGEMREGVDRIGLIVRELKTYGRAAAEEMEEGARVERVVSYALRIVKSETAKRARVVTELGDVPAVRIAEPQLGQVLVNLLINAAQAIDGDAAQNEVRVSSAWDGAARAVVLRVTDTGPGIPANVLPRIFDPFFTTKPVGVGTGLGLFVCRNLVEAAGGTITVQSKRGQGTTFTVSLPPAPHGPAEEATRTTREKVAQAAPAARVVEARA
jgi:PAS domain S-box-containing protein